MEKADLLTQVINLIQSLFSKPSTPAPVPIPEQTAPQSEKPILDWTNPKCHVTEHFTVEDACMLHSWNRLATEKDGFDDAMKAKLIVVCQKMEEVRAALGCPIKVHCMFRSQEYNRDVVKAKPDDVHAQGLAADFDCSPALTIDQIKEKMEPLLATMNIRMEFGTTTWIHLDLRAPGPSGRYFHA